MTNPYDAAWAEAQATPSGDQVELPTIELIHPAITDDNGQQIAIRAVNDVVGRDLPLEDSALINPGETVSFAPIPFEMPWPETEDGKVPSVRIRIDNIGREVVPYLDAAVLVDAPLVLIFRYFLLDVASQAVELAADPMTFYLRQVTVNEQFVEGTASPSDLENLQFLRQIYDVEHYPALSQ